jgi:50S ribosome-binding GTPase
VFVDAAMTNLSSRTLTSQLADDLGWLEQHCRRQPDLGQNAGKLRLAAALVRNCIFPLLDEQAPVPLHIAVVGGAGAGKSTVANMLSGALAAEANPQAGFTRHPIAYTSKDGVVNWSGHLGFLGPLQRLTQPTASSLDQDVYQVRRVPPDPTSYDLLKDFVVWDCPDMTTWAAANYLSRLLEASALADVVVYVASDERYNDEVPTQFLRLLLQTGKPVIVCLMKMRDEDAPALVAHFQREVVSQLPPGILGTLAIPFLTPEQLADPARKAVKYRIPLINQVAVLGGSATTTRQRSIYGAMAFLRRQQEELLSAARKDVLAMQSWQAAVQSGRLEFEQRYFREYLTTEKFRGFDEALVRLIELLDLPGVGKVLSGALYVLRTPYRLLKGWISQAVNRPETVGRPEQPVLEEALTGWIDMLRKEAARQSGTHPLWVHVSQGFQSGRLTEATRERFHLVYRNFQVGLTDEVERTARSIYEQLERNPVVLNTLRGGKFALDVAAIAGTVAAGPGWYDFILVPLIASLTHQLVELLGYQVVESQREMTRQRQQALMTQHLSQLLAEWLAAWPATGGSTFERLQLALRRIPPAIQQLDSEIRMKYETGK